MRVHRANVSVVGTVVGLLVGTCAVSHSLPGNPKTLASATTPAATDHFAAASSCSPGLDDPDFKGGGDEVTSRIVGLTGSRFFVEVELLDQSIAYPFVRDLLQDESDPCVARFAHMFLENPAGSELIATASIDVRR